MGENNLRKKTNYIDLDMFTTKESCAVKTIAVQAAGITRSKLANANKIRFEFKAGRETLFVRVRYVSFTLRDANANKFDAKIESGLLLRIAIHKKCDKEENARYMATANLLMSMSFREQSIYSTSATVFTQLDMTDDDELCSVQNTE